MSKFRADSEVIPVFFEMVSLVVDNLTIKATVKAIGNEIILSFLKMRNFASTVAEAKTNEGKLVDTISTFVRRYTSETVSKLH